MGKGKSFQEMVQDQLNFCLEGDLTLISYAKNNSKRIRGLIAIVKTIKLLEKNIRENICDLGV